MARKEIDIMNKTKFDRRRKYYLVLDCETATMPYAQNFEGKARQNIAIAKPLIYDLGWQIIDRNGNVYAKRNFLISEIFSVPAIFNTAYYASKRPLYLEKLQNCDIDTLILGCTHYPIIKKLVASCAKELFGREIAIIDSGYEAALAAKDMLAQKNLLTDLEGEGSVSYFVSDETQNFSAVASIFLGEAAQNVTKVTIG